MKMNARKTQVPRVIGVTGIVVSLLLCPPVFNRSLAMYDLLPRDRFFLWVAALMLFSISFIILKWKFKGRDIVSAFLFSVLLVVGFELGVRGIVSYFYPQKKGEFARMGLRTLPSYIPYRGHPFLHFTGVPSSSLNNHQLDILRPQFNNYGFRDNDFETEKREGTIRIACLGGSTTYNGYPEILENLLNQKSKSLGVEQFEVLNFGFLSWTSAHSLVNFVLNVVDFDPDYVVIHHGWNEQLAYKPRNFFRGDYFHAFKPFQISRIPDRYLIRMSVLYRGVKYAREPVPVWADLINGIRRQGGYGFTPERQEKVVGTFKRNIQTIIDLSLKRGIQVILTTMPHSTNENIRYYDPHLRIDRHNQALRQIARENEGEIAFVDLDQLMTGKMEYVFNDFGHVSKEGKDFKAVEVSKAVFADLVKI